MGRWAWTIWLLMTVAPACSAAVEGRVIILGFDGADAGLTERYMAEGHLPHLAQLRANGTYRSLGTTTPPQTPVSWSSFATGQNPGKNGVFDFLRRDPDTYMPDFAMFAISTDPFLWGENNHFLVGIALAAMGILLGLLIGAAAKKLPSGLLIGALAGVIAGGSALVWAKDWLPYQKPSVENTRQGDAFWEVAGAAGIPTTIVRVPATFPPRPVDHGRLLSGLGTPDIRGSNGTYSIYTSEPPQENADTEFGGKLVEVTLINGRAQSHIYGPKNRLFNEPPDILLPVEFYVDRSDGAAGVTITASDQSQTVAEGGWSDWYSLEFKFSPVVKAYGNVRFFVISLSPFKVYMSPVNLDPHRPVMPVSQPTGFSGDLADRHGLFKTLGWSMETWALNELQIDEATFLEDVYFTEDKYTEMMKALLEEDDFRLYVQVFELTDRVAHMFWRLLDPEHPSYDSALAEEYGDAVLNSYIYMDNVVGQAMQRLKPDDLLLIASDHGFHTWHKSVNYNTWLVKNGFMTLKQTDVLDTQKNLDDLFGQGELWPNVDWKRTKAYALGLGDIYLNVKGREAEGIVLPGEEYERIRNAIISGLESFRDPETGDLPVSKVLKREEIYNDFDENLIPDLLVANNPKYRVSWQTSLGGIPKDLLEVNTRKWSGDHCSLDASKTKGIFFSNKPMDADGVTILDFFPTVTGYLGLKEAEGLDGRALKVLSGY